MTFGITYLKELLVDKVKLKNLVDLCLHFNIPTDGLNSEPNKQHCLAHANFFVAPIHIIFYFFSYPKILPHKRRKNLFKVAF